MCCCLFLCWCWTSGQQQPKKISFSFFFSLFFLVFDFFFCFFSLFLSLLFSFFSFFFFLPPWVYYILFFSRFHPDFFPTFSNRFALPKNASIFGDPHTARRVLDARALAPRSPLACIIGIKIHAHVADFYCFLILFPTFSIYYLLSIIYYLISLSHIAYLLSKQKERTAFAPFLLFVYTQPGVQPESLLPTS